MTSTSGAQATISVARRVGVERHDEVDARKCREHRHPVVQRVERAIVALAEAPDRRVGVDGDDERCAERLRLLEIRDVAAMQQIEHAVGEDERPRQRGDAHQRVGGRGDLRRVARLGQSCGRGRHRCA